MSPPLDRLPDAYSLDEVARAAGVSISRVEELAARAEMAMIGGFAGASEFVSHAEAVGAVRALRLNQDARRDRSSPGGVYHVLFDPPSTVRRSASVPIVLSSLVHGVAFAALAIATSMGLAPASAADEGLLPRETPMRLVYIATPGPGGGGGGGGLKQRTAPPKAERKGRARLSSPLPPRQTPEPIVAVPEPPEPPPPILEAEPLPPLIAPVVKAAANDRDRAGVLQEAKASVESRGPGSGGGSGTGIGTGIGEGDGSGIGPGAGGGIGGGPYRPGSGITPPRLLREVKPDYTEDARRQGVEGEVVLEIVVRRDGSVGDIRLVAGLGDGLNERATAAVRQWRFSPARRQGAPVDVLVEVSVEFRLR